MAVHNSLEALWKDEHMPIHAEESILDRPAAPEVLSAVERMKDPFKSSQITGRCSFTGTSGGMMADGTISFPGGCFFLDFPYIVRSIQVGLAVHV